MDKKETKKKLDAEELEKRSAPFVSGPMDDTGGGGGGTPSPDRVFTSTTGGEEGEPTLPEGGGGGGGSEPRIDKAQHGSDVDRGAGFRRR